MAVIHLNKAEFDVKIPAAPLAMVDFWAGWCGPCRMIAPVIEELGAQYEGRVLVGKVDVDAEGELAVRYGVMSIPTIIFFKNGKEIARKVGVMPAAAFTEVLEANL